MKDNLSKLSDIAITIDFWSDKKFVSYLVLTGHFLSEDFKSNSTILQFSSFDQRHFSDLIGQEIEKQLVDLNIFDKISTITSDNTPNMIGLFQHLSRDIKHIPCMAHMLHLVICNGLGIWEETNDNDDLNQTTDKSINNTDENKFDEGLTQLFRKMSIGDVDNGHEGEKNNQEIEEPVVINGDVSKVFFIAAWIFLFVVFQASEDEIEWDDDDQNEMTHDGEGGEDVVPKDAQKGHEEDNVDDSDCENDEIEDNFQIGLITDTNDAEKEEASIAAKQQIRSVLSSE